MISCFQVISGSTSGNTLNGTGFNSGILSFSGPVTTLTVTGGVGSSYQGLTFAAPADVSDGGSTVLLLGVGLTGLVALYRRRIGKSS